MLCTEHDTSPNRTGIVHVNPLYAVVVRDQLSIYMEAGQVTLPRMAAMRPTCEHFILINFMGI